VKNKHKWEYRYYAELIGGGYIDHIVIITQGGRKVADLHFEKALDNWCEQFGREPFWYEFKGKERVAS
tara:strand:- start:1117 stop:1320 length:204 start_codon:yes stop_codon:yes gene_type:complete